MDGECAGNSFKLTKSSEVDLSVGASVDSDGAAGAHGQARVNFLF